MDEQQPNENRPTIPTWVWIITIFAVILGVQLFITRGFDSAEEKSNPDFFNMVLTGEIDTIINTNRRGARCLLPGAFAPTYAEDRRHGLVGAEHARVAARR